MSTALIPGSLTRNDRWLAIALALLLLAVYLATTDLSFHMIDEPGSYIVSRNLAARGSYDTDVLFWVWVPLYRGSIVAEGVDGHTYLTKDYLPLLLDVPFIWLARALNVSPIRGSLLLFPLVTALTGALVYAGIRLFGYSQATGLLGGLTFGLATLAWPYAGMLFSQPLAGLGLLIALIGTVVARERGSWRAALIAGLGLGAGGASSSTPWITAPLYFLYLIPWELFGKASWKEIARRTLPLFIAFGVGASVFGVSQLIYNAARFGSPASTGHDQNRTQDIRLMYFGQGGFGQALSTVRGLIWFAPFSLLIPVSVWLGWRARSRWVWLALAQSLLVWVFTSSHYSWWGGHAWGPRYLLTAMPIFAMLAVPVLDRLARPDASLWAQIAAGAVLVISALTQLMSVLFDYLFTEVEIANVLDRITPPRQFFAYHPFLMEPSVIPQVRLIYTAMHGEWDVLWMPNGQLDGLLLAMSVLFVALGVACLLLALRPHRLLPMPAVLIGQSILTAVFAVFILLRYPHGPYDRPALDALTHELNQRTQPGDGVLPILPESYLDWMDQFDGSVPDIGVMMEDPLSERTERKLEWLPGWHDRIWVVEEGTMGGNPANGVELWLSEHGYVGTETWVEGYRLVPYTFAAGESPQPSGVSFDEGQITLDSFSLEQHYTLDRGGWLNVLLSWQTSALLEHDYTVFVHLLDATGALVAQHDGIPSASYAPTRTWQPGQIIEDRRSVQLPALLSPGEYRLFAGLYDPLTGERLPLVDGSSNAVLLEVLRIP